MILWWWFNGNWYNIITILIPIESKWWAKWWQNVGKYMLYWKCIGTYLEHHLKFIWNYEHHVSQHGTSYDYMMNIWWTLYEICMNTVATCGNQVNGSNTATCQTCTTGWMITGWPVHPAQWPLCWRCHIPILMGIFSTWPVLQFLLRISMGMMMRMILYPASPLPSPCPSGIIEHFLRFWYQFEFDLKQLESFGIHLDMNWIYIWIYDIMIGYIILYLYFDYTLYIIIWSYMIIFFMKFDTNLIWICFFFQHYLDMGWTWVWHGFDFGLNEVWLRWWTMRSWWRWCGSWDFSNQGLMNNNMSLWWSSLNCPSPGRPVSCHLLERCIERCIRIV